ncbi:hypothetical protein RJ639_030533 [Escallonia herrerae]|uniref:Auxin-responsive protein n=1 Tax=Escallonia herrerae TaxID=1293975 RepID=A0AA88X142_9ASTE|nr:hypothetical protein RJ639_030533 [Escallonia herrerae]
MDSNTSGNLLNHTTLPSVYYQGKADGSTVDLGLSLRALQPEAYHPTGHGDYGDFLGWHQWQPQLKGSDFAFPRKCTEDFADETEGVQSKERWAYVKVNMEGVIVGRKVCILDHTDYSSLAIQLEDMFGRQSIWALRLFQVGSQFSLFYKDRNEQWRIVGDVPWKEFVDCVKRLRIVRKNEVLVSSSSTFA